MNKLLGFLGLIVFTAFVGFFLFKNRPKSHNPIKVMNPTYFDDVGKIGRVISRRYYVHLKKAKLVVIGSSALLKDQHIFWQEFIKTNYVDGIKFDQVVSIEGLAALTAQDQFYQELPKLDNLSGRTLVHVPSDEAWKVKVDEAYPGADFVFFQAPFSMREERREQLGLECQSDKDESFSCLAYKAGTRYYRKKRKDNKLTAMMEQLGRNFFIIFVGEKY